MRVVYIINQLILSEIFSKLLSFLMNVINDLNYSQHKVVLTWGFFIEAKSQIMLKLIQNIVDIITSEYIGKHKINEKSHMYSHRMIICSTGPSK